MAAPAAERERQERLREAAALGDAEEVRRLVELGVGLNSQNEVNGWTCLHWACKRNHAPVVAYLLHAGADKEILTKKGERPAQLTSKREIRKMLGVEDDELPDLKKDSDLPIIPNYLANPPFPYVYNTMSKSIPDPSMNGSISHLESQDTNSSSLPDVETYTCAPLQHGNAAPRAADNGGMPSLPRGCTVPPHSKTVLQRSPVYQGSVSWSTSPPSPAGSNQSIPQQENGSCMGPVPAFQPVFFTGAFPLNMQGNTKTSHFVVELLYPVSAGTVIKILMKTFAISSEKECEYAASELKREPHMAQSADLSLEVNDYMICHFCR
uniref:Ankyrin repeat domain-containing protein 40 n=1 Tax=Accipiter nisus TaxID=211598 RepID=A0A8B9N6U9_9AVES